MKKSPSIIALAAAGLALGACSTTNSGANAASPDEFRTVSKAPLVLPPDFNLRPPKPGEPRPQDLTPTAAARAALQASMQGSSAGERALVAQSGGDLVSPAVRAVVDLEAGGVTHKTDSVADMVLASDPDAGLDEEELARRARAVEAATGGQEVTIERDTARIKLPGL